MKLHRAAETAMMLALCAAGAVSCGGSSAPPADGGSDRPDTGSITDASDATRDGGAGGADAANDATGSDAANDAAVGDATVADATDATVADATVADATVATATDATATDATDTAATDAGSVGDAPDGASPDAGDGGAPAARLCGALTWGSTTGGALAPGGGTFAVASGSSVEVRSWDTTNKLPIVREAAGGQAVAYSGDGALLFVRTAADIGVWRTSDGQLVERITSLQGTSGLAVSRDGSVVAGIGGSSLVVRRPAGVINIGASIGASGVAVSPDGTRVAAVYTDLPASSGTRTYKFGLWSTADGASVQTFVSTTGTGPVAGTRMVFSKDGTRIAFGTYDQNQSGGILSATAGGGFTPVGSTNTPTRPLEFSDDNLYLTGVTGNPAQLTVWRASDGANLQMVPLGVMVSAVVTGGFGPSNVPRAVVVSPPTTGEDAGFRLVTGDAAPPRTIPVVGVVGGSAVSMSADGRRLAAFVDSNIRIFDLVTGNLFPQRWPGVGPFALSPDGARLAYSTTSAYYVSPTDQRNDIALNTTMARQLAFSPDSTLVATANLDHTAQLWSATTGALVRTFWKDLASGHSDAVTGVNFTADGATLVTASADRTVKLWRTADGELLRTISTGSFGGFTHVLITPDAKRVFADSGTQFADVDVTAGTSTLRITPSVASSLAMFGAGDMLAGTAQDQVLRFRVSDLSPLAPLPVPGALWRFLAMSSDGGTVAVGGGTGNMIRIVCQ